MLVLTRTTRVHDETRTIEQCRANLVGTMRRFMLYFGSNFTRGTTYRFFQPLSHDLAPYLWMFIPKSTITAMDAITNKAAPVEEHLRLRQPFPT